MLGSIKCAFFDIYPFILLTRQAGVHSEVDEFILYM